MSDQPRLLTLDDLPVVEKWTNKQRAEFEEGAHGQAIMRDHYRALLHMDLRRMTLNEIVAEWHIANGQELTP